MKKSYLIPIIIAIVVAIIYFSSNKAGGTSTPPINEGTTPQPVPGGGSSSNAPSIPTTTIQSFPAQVTVNTAVLNVRSGPSTSYPQAGSMTLNYGDQFTAMGYVHGQSVSGNDIWFVSSLGHYVWSGGTDQTPASSVAPMSASAQTSNSSSNVNLSSVLSAGSLFNSPFSILGIPL